MEPSFEKLLVLLADGGVRFVVVGGIAVAIQGHMRFTEDVDILIDAEASNVSRLLEVLAGYGEGFATELSLSDFGDDEGAVRIIEETELCQIDIFTRMSGLYYSDLIDKALQIDLQGRSVSIASKADLIRLKSSSHREKDRLDVIALSHLPE